MLRHLLKRRRVQRKRLAPTRRRFNSVSVQVRGRSRASSGSSFRSSSSLSSSSSRHQLAKMRVNTPPPTRARARYSARRSRQMRRRGGTLPLPSGSFPREYEMTGSYIPLVPATVSSTYPQVMRPTYVISIRPERMLTFVRRMGAWSMHCKRPPCVVGKTLNLDSLYRSHTVRRGSLSPGQIGCWLSHLKAWEGIAASPYDMGTVAEDDAALEANVHRVDQAMNELTQKRIPWDILFWCSSPLPHVQRGLKPCGLTHWKRVPQNNCMGCVAYTIKKSVAQRWISQARPIHSPVDVWVSQFFGSFNVYCIQPVLGFCHPGPSDTEDTASPGYLRFL